VWLISEGWFGIDLTVAAEPPGTEELTGVVTFYIHDTFQHPVREVQASDGKAFLGLRAYGAFTVGVHVEDFETLLELDLAQIEDAPKTFRER
jgi:hypothetical protein